MDEAKRAPFSLLAGVVCCLMSWWAFWFLAPPTGIGNHGVGYAMLSLLTGLVAGLAGALVARWTSKP